MRDILKKILLVFIISLLTFIILDLLAGSLFIQWNGQPLPYLQREILFIAIVFLRSIIAEGIMLKMFGGQLKKENLLVSMIVFGLPLFIIQLVSGVNIIFNLITSLSPFEPRTLFYAIFSFTILLLLLEFSRLYILYLIRKKRI